MVQLTQKMYSTVQRVLCKNITEYALPVYIYLFLAKPANSGRIPPRTFILCAICALTYSLLSLLLSRFRELS